MWHFRRMLSGLFTMLIMVCALLALLAWLALPGNEKSCDASRLKHMEFIGKPYTKELAENARRASGAALVRPAGRGIRSGADVRSDRLDVWLDDRGNVKDFMCEQP
jgi:hypothetical protein